MPAAFPPLLRAEFEAPTRAQLTPPVGFPAIGPDRVQNGVGPTFGQPTIAGIQGIGFEPDLRLDPTTPSRLYASVPGSLSSNDSWVWTSIDSGKTWKWVTASHPKVGKPVSCAGGGDTELAVDAAHRLYFNDLTLANFSIARSDNQGQSFPCNNTGVPSTLVDRQWYALDGDPTALGPGGSTANSLYLASNDVGQGAPNCAVSGAGNNVLVVYRSLPGPLGGLQFGPSNKVAGVGTCDEGIMGNIEVSPVPTTTGEVGQLPLAQAVRHVYVIHDDATFSKIRIGRCIPVSPGPPLPNMSDPSGLRCNEFVVKDLGDSTTIRTGANFPTLAIDNAGNLYAVWEEAPVDAGGNIGDVSMRYSYSTNEGVTWSAPITISPPSLKNNVMAWTAAGDDGRVDIAWYGTPASVNPALNGTVCPLNPPAMFRGGPDTVNGVWSLYVTQTTNGHDPSPTFTAPILAGEHHNHRGSVATVMGGLCGDRTALGDFFQLRIGPQGEANIIYSDSNNVSGLGHMMFVRQNGGPGVSASQLVNNDPILTNSAPDPSGDGTRDLDGTTSANFANLDLTNSSFTRPAPASCHPVNTPCYRIQMTLNDLTSLVSPVPGDPVLLWSTQWFAPSDPACVSAAAGCANGGRNFHVYAESDSGAAIRCFFGENFFTLVGGGATMTYPPATSGEIAGAGCAKSGSTVTIEVPIANASLEAGVAPVDANRLFSVTTSTMTLPVTADSVPALGVPPDVIDVVRGYDVQFGTPTAVKVRSFSARADTGRVVLRWRTASDAGIAGFNVYRGQARLNRALIGAVGGVHGHLYIWRGQTAGRGAYRLQAVGLDGARAWVGRASLR